MTSYRKAYNSAEDIFFELLKDIPDTPLPLALQLDSDFLTRLVRTQPSVTPRELCIAVLKERGVTIAPQSLCKLLLRVGLNRAARRQVSVKLVHPLREAA